MPVQINSETLKYAQKWLEYKNDIVKFAEECIKLPLPGGDTLVKLYEPQKKVLKSFLNDHYLCLLKSRQTGFSTLSQIIVTYIATFYENCVMGVLSRDGSESSDFCRKVEDMIDKLPKWLQPEYKNKAVQFFILKNGCQLHSSAVSPANPGAVFRGKSIVLLIIDECAFINHIKEAWTSMAPTLMKAQNVAKQLGIPFGTILLSTPNRSQGIGQFYYQMWCASQNEDALFKGHKVYWKSIPDFVNDKTWYKRQCDLLNNDPRLIAQELELQFIGSNNTLFPAETQEILNAVTDSNIINQIALGTGHKLFNFKPINKYAFYVIGVDTASEAGGIDYSAIEVFEYISMEQVLEFKGKLPVKIFSSYVKLVAKMCPNNIIVVESNSYGNQVIEELIYDQEYQYNLYGETRGKDNATFIPGLSTNVKTRPLIVDALYHYVTEFPTMIKSYRLALELIGLTDKVKRVEAEIGSNDDLALALGFICYVRHYAKDVLQEAEEKTKEAQLGTDVMVSESLSLISELNNPNRPLGFSYKTDNYNSFVKNMDKYIRENTGVGLQGQIDIRQLYLKGGNFFNLF